MPHCLCRHDLLRYSPSSFSTNQIATYLSTSHQHQYSTYHHRAPAIHSSHRRRYFPRVSKLGALKLMGRKIQKILNANKMCVGERYLRYIGSTHQPRHITKNGPSSPSPWPCPQNSAFACCLPFEGQTFVSTHSTNSQQCLSDLTSVMHQHPPSFFSPSHLA